MHEVACFTLPVDAAHKICVLIEGVPSDLSAQPINLTSLLNPNDFLSSEKEMPGRHGKQVKKRNRSKRQPATEMETTLKDSIHGRTRKERAILRDLIPPAVKHVTKKIGLPATLPLFSAPPTPPQSLGAVVTKETAKTVKSNKKKTIKAQ